MGPRAAAGLLPALLFAVAHGLTKEQAVEVAKLDVSWLKANTDELKWLRRQPYTKLMGLKLADYEVNTPKLAQSYKDMGAKYNVPPEEILPQVFAHMNEPEMIPVLTERWELLQPMTKQQVVDTLKGEIAAWTADTAGLGWYEKLSAADRQKLTLESYKDKAPVLFKFYEDTLTKLDIPFEHLLPGIMVYAGDAEVKPLMIERMTLVGVPNDAPDMQKKFVHGEL